MKKHHVDSFGEGFVEISQCWHQCPYFSLEGYRLGDTPGKAMPMYCSHHESIEQPYIIDMANSINRFPDECPLNKNRKGVKVAKMEKKSGGTLPSRKEGKAVIGRCRDCRWSKPISSGQGNEDHEFWCQSKDQCYQVNYVCTPCKVKAEYGCVFWEAKE